LARAAGERWEAMIVNKRVDDQQIRKTLRSTRTGEGGEDDGNETRGACYIGAK
jgi:hypothetical protein